MMQIKPGAGARIDGARRQWSYARSRPQDFPEAAE
jgi:hypothetical protein